MSSIFYYSILLLIVPLPKSRPATIKLQGGLADTICLFQPHFRIPRIRIPRK